MQIAKRLLCTGVLILSGSTGTHLAAQEPPPQIHACVGPAGSVRILSAGQSCKSNETSLTWSVDGGAAPPAPAPTPPQQSEGSGLRVFNALGAEVGPLIGPSMAAVTLPTGRKAAAELYPTPPANWLVSQYYQSTDCSGEPLVAWTPIEELLAPALVRQSGVWALRPGSLAGRALGSWRSIGDNGSSSACQPMMGTFETWQFDFYTPEQVGLVYPLSVQ